MFCYWPAVYASTPTEEFFAPGGFVHLECRGPYFETQDIAAPLLHFSPALSDAERDELRAACGG